MSFPDEGEYLEEWEYPEEGEDGWEYYEDDPYEQATPLHAFPGGCLPGMLFPLAAVLAISGILFLTLGRITISIAYSPDAAGTANEETASVPAENLVETGLAPLFTPQVHAWASQILEWAGAWQMDPNLIATVMQIESCGDPQAVSTSGAMGLFQVMPFHFAAGEDGYDPQTNARRGLAYLESALEARGGEARLALAGYNAGINGAQRPEHLWPAETVRYVYWGLGIYTDARQGKSSSQHLDEWLNSGGARLCAQAGERLGLAP